MYIWTYGSWIFKVSRWKNRSMRIKHWWKFITDNGVNFLRHLVVNYAWTLWRSIFLTYHFWQGFIKVSEVLIVLCRYDLLVLLYKVAQALLLYCRCLGFLQLLCQFLLQLDCRARCLLHCGKAFKLLTIHELVRAVLFKMAALDIKRVWLI